MAGRGSDAVVYTLITAGIFVCKQRWGKTAGTCLSVTLESVHVTQDP